MKWLIIAALFPLPGFGQHSLDTTWRLTRLHFFRMTLQTHDTDADKNTRITLYREKTVVLTDSIYCSGLSVRFDDMNRDGYKDVLVYEGSGARANERYHLFLYLPQQNTFKKVIGFNEWPNISVTDIKGVLVATVLTGTVDYHFFRVTGSGKLMDLGISETDWKLDGSAYDVGLTKVRKLLSRQKQ